MPEDAEGLAQLSEILVFEQPLGGTAPVAATATIRISSTSEEDDVARTEEGEAIVDLERTIGVVDGMLKDREAQRAAG